MVNCLPIIPFGMIVQIYEIQEPVEAALMVECGVDHIGGVVLSLEEWKIPALRESVAVIRDAGCRSSLIPLFGNPDYVYRVIEYSDPDLIHFCEIINLGKDIDEAVLDSCITLQSAVRDRFPGVRIMRTIPIAEPGLGKNIPTLELARRLEPVSDWFLTDTMLSSATQPVAGHVGITGKICDLGVASDLVKSSGIPVILAGGLSPTNVADSLRITKPAGADTCTATNLLDSSGKPIRFRKDPEKVRRFVQECRNSGEL